MDARPSHELTSRICRDGRASVTAPPVCPVIEKEGSQMPRKAKPKTARDLVSKLAALSNRLEKAGGPEEDAATFERVLSAGDALLAHFGLPPAQDYANAIDVDYSAIDEKRIDELLATLAHLGEQYRNRPKENDLGLLREAALEKQEPGYILPRIGMTHHTYHEFLYSQVDTDPARIDESASAILAEMRVAEPVLGKLGLLEVEGARAHPKILVALQQLDLPHLEGFLAQFPEEPLRYRLSGQDMFDGTAYVLESYRSRRDALVAAKRRAKSCRQRAFSSTGDTRSIEDCTLVEDTSTGEILWDSRKDFPLVARGQRSRAPKPRRHTGLPKKAT